MKIKRFADISSEIPVASMSDIAFLLIVFFMIVAVFSIEAGFLLKLPSKDKPPLQVSDTKIIEIKIAQDNTLTLDGTLVSFADLGTTIDAEPQRTQNFVAIKAHAQSQYKTSVQVIERFHRSGYNKISLKRLEP
jgi:biopolymer transport protein ExbD